MEAYYRTKEWKQLRDDVLERDKWVCHYCGRTAATADHVVPRSRGGPDTSANLVAVCHPCNKTARSSMFTDLASKRAWVLEVRGLGPKVVRAPTKRSKVPVATKVRLTGLRKKLALKHRPQHIRDALLNLNSDET